MRTLSIVIPALNERHGLERVLRAVPAQALHGLGYCPEVIVVDGGSTDGTRDVARTCGAEVLLESVRGYGRALKLGFARASGDVIVIVDADGSYPAEEIPRLLKVLDEENLEFLIASRFNSLTRSVMHVWNRIGNSVLSLTVRLLFGLRMGDPESGMFVFRRELLPKLRLGSDGWPFSHEIKIEACYYCNARWKEVPIPYRQRVGETKLGNVWIVGLFDLLHIARMRFFRARA